MMFKTFLLFTITALMELTGCYCAYLWLRLGKSAWLLMPCVLALAVFVWLLSLHPQASGRVYAAYGGIYIACALVWLWLVDGIRPQWPDYLGVGLCIAGSWVIILGRYFSR